MDQKMETFYKHHSCRIYDKGQSLLIPAISPYSKADAFNKNPN